MGWVCRGTPLSVVMPGPDPGIHSVMWRTTNAYQFGGRPNCMGHARDRKGRSSSGMDARIKSGHDERRGMSSNPALAISGTSPLAKTPKSLSLPHGERGEQGAPWGILGSGPRMTTEGRGSALGLTPHTFRTSHITHSSSTPRPGPTRHLRHRARSSRGQKSRRRRRLSGTGSPVRE